MVQPWPRGGQPGQQPPDPNNPNANPWTEAKFENIPGTAGMKPKRNFGVKLFSDATKTGMIGMDWAASAQAGYRKDQVHNPGLRIIDLGRILPRNCRNIN